MYREGDQRMNQHRRAVASWCLYDWANSAFTTLVVTFVYATYFTQTFADNADLGTALWSRGIAISAVLIAISSPILGALADRGGSRRRMLVISTLLCVVATGALTFIVPGTSSAVWLALLCFIVANVAFEVGTVFYNSFLASLATPQTIGRISGYGWGLGYVGGLACLVVALLGFVGIGGDPWFALPQDSGFHIRATNLLVAGWLLLFSLPMLLWVREPTIERAADDLNAVGGRAQVAQAFSDLKRTLLRIRDFPEIVRFLIAHLIYNDGLVTVFAFGGIYAAGTFGLEYDEVILFGIALNVAAGLGAWLFGFVDDWIGGKATVMVSLVALAGAATLAVLAPNRTWFWVAGLLIGTFAGPNQAASRSLMARFVPERNQSEFFGFYAFAGKATSFLGPFLLGILSATWGQRAGVSVVLAFFVVGGIVLYSVDERRGCERARET